MKDHCIITFCDKNYLKQAEQTIFELRTNGKYDDEIVLMVGDDLKDYKTNDVNVIVKYFPTIDRSNVIRQLNGISTSDGRDLHKTFQWHKIYTFHPYFKQWKKCMLLDGGMKIYNPVHKMLNINCDGHFMAHSDSYPTYQLKLSCQFESTRFKELYQDLCSKYDLNIDYFQTGMYLFDSNIIDDNILEYIMYLGNKYINTRTNEQAIMNLVFNCEKKIWKQIQIKDDSTYYYDHYERENLNHKNYIMLKLQRT